MKTSKELLGQLIGTELTVAVIRHDLTYPTPPAQDQ